MNPRLPVWRRRPFALVSLVGALVGATVLAVCGQTGTEAGATAGASVLVSAEEGAGLSSWPSPDHDLSNSREAVGSPITAANIHRLVPTWSVGVSGGLPTSPVIVGNAVFVEDQLGEVFRIDLTTGKVVWKTASTGYTVGPNGVAVGWGKVFGVTTTSVFALDQRTGRMLWSSRLTRTATDGIDVQPQVVGSDVIVSTVPVSIAVQYHGGDRGFIDAVAEKNGRQLWSFDTVASPTLWGNPTLNSGGGSWYPPSYSASRRLLYVGVANPAPFVGTPQYPNGSSRPGPNRYTDSTVALNIKNGRLVWSLQAFPHDLFDRDFVHTMVVPVPAGQGHPATTVVVGTGKGGEVIGMNPSNGHQLWKTPVGKHLNDDLKALSGPTEILPGTFGGVLTPPASAHGQVFVATLNAPDTLYPDQTAYFGGKTGTMPGDVVAIDARTGRTLWTTAVPGDPTGGVTVVNDLVLTATLQGTVYGLSRSDGRIRWHIQAPGGIDGWMSVSGKTVVIPVGFAKPPTIWALRL